MPTEAIIALVQACVIGFVIGAVVMSFHRLKAGGPGAKWKDALWPLACLLGATGGYLRIIGEFPPIWPREATERFAFFVLPMAVALDAAVTILAPRRVWRWVIWIAASIATPTLLFWNRVADLADGADARSPGEVITRLLVMAVALGLATMIVGHALRASETSDPASAKLELQTRALPAVLLAVFAFAGITLLASGTYRLGALALSAVMAPLTGAWCTTATSSPQNGRISGPLIFILPIGSMIILGHELADLKLHRAALLALAVAGPAFVVLPPLQNGLRKSWHAVIAMILIGLIPAAGAAIPALIAAAKAATNDDGY